MSNVTSTHSPFFAPAREPTLRAGLAALTVGALTYLGQENPDASPISAAPESAPVSSDVPTPEPSGDEDAHDNAFLAASSSWADTVGEPKQGPLTEADTSDVRWTQGQEWPRDYARV